MKRFTLLLVALSLSLFFTAFSQDETPEPDPAPTEPAPAPPVPEPAPTEPAPAPPVPEPDPASPEPAPAPPVPEPAPTEPAPAPPMPEPALPAPLPMPVVPVPADAPQDPAVVPPLPVMPAPATADPGNAPVGERQGRPRPAPGVPAPGVPAPGLPMPVATEPGVPAPEVVATPEAPPAPELERPRQAPPSEETATILAEPEKRDRTADVKEAQTIKDDKDASRLIYSILGGAAAGAIAAKVATGGQRNQPQGPGTDPRFAPGQSPPPGYNYPRPPRLSEAESGRSQRDRERSVSEMARQFEGQQPLGAGRTQPSGTGGIGNRVPPGQNYPNPNSFPNPRDQVAQPRHGAPRSAPMLYEGNRRVVRYSSQSEIPPIIIANSYLNRVEVVPSHQVSYRPISEAPRWAPVAEQPDAYYQSQSAYAVSYQVDPNSAVSRDDILFRQGSTAFADAYSYDLVIDIAEAINHPNLYNESFIIEGHASAEGSYSGNLNLSQLRAERIAQELVRYGVAPERLLPVGYGESEAAYPADSPEQFRSLDRRVMIFRMQ